MNDSIKYKIKNSHYYKFGGIPPEGFSLIPTKTMERLMDFDNWKEWKNNPEVLEKWMIEDVEKI